MPWYYQLLLGLALVATGLSYNLPRAWLWIGLGALSFITSSWWHYAALPHATAFGATTNLIICFLMYIYARQRWEMRVWNCFHLMIVIDLLYMWGWIDSHYLFTVGLEIANWLALIIIGGTGLLSMVAANGIPDRTRHSGWVYRLHHALHKKRSDTPFGQVP